MWYFSVPLINLQASISLISHLFLLLAWISSGGGLIYPSKGSIVAFYSLSSEKTGWTLTEFRSFTLYKLPIFSKILYGPAIQ
jgi:hypothetical protein